MSSQLEPDNFPSQYSSHSLLLIPIICAVASTLALVVHKCSSGLRFRGVSLNRSVQNANATPRLYSSGFPIVTSQRSRPDPSSRAKMWKLFRLAACFALVMVSITAIALASGCQKATSANGMDQNVPDTVSHAKYGFGHGRGRKHKIRHPTDFCLSSQQTEQLAIAAFYAYTAVLALLAVALEHRFRKVCNVHLTILLLLALVIDIWVIILPTIATGFPPTIDAPLEWVLLARTAILAFAAVVIPFNVQHAYVMRDREITASRPTGSVTGRLVAKDLTARSSSDGPLSLKKLNFTVNPGERVCVIGKDEGGRWMLALALLRAIPTTGKVYLDGISTHTIAHEALSTHITFISEQPGVLGGTVRQILNPQGLYGDVTLLSTLHSLGLELNLDSSFDKASGTHKRQALLAKALICRSKLVILEDEDQERTLAIRFTIQTRLPHSTLIILGNRLQSVRDVDQVMVLESGKIVEFGPPRMLLRKWTGPFKGMVNASEYRNELYACFCK